MTAPLVSVCVPTRDRRAWLGEALESVFAQSLVDFEVVVGDDASSDGTFEWLAERAAAWGPRLRVIRHGRPLGVAANRNACLAAARGRYVAWLDSDDRYLPGMLDTQVAALERHPEAAMAAAGFEVIDGGGRRLPGWPPWLVEDRFLDAATALSELVTGNPIGAPTVVVRRDAHDRVGPYRETLASGEDWEMWLRLALAGGVAYSAATVAQYRWHADSLARTAETSGQQLARDRRAVLGFLARNRSRLGEASAALAARARAALAARALLHATDSLSRGRRRQALRALRFVTRLRPELVRRPSGWRLLTSAALGSEYEWHRASRAALAALAGELEGSRLGDRLRRAAPAPEWDATLGGIAATVREVVPPGAPIAVIDKWDPTVIHLSGRRGWHFPDRTLSPDGYPADGVAAVRHLESLRDRGAAYLVVPCSGFWWFDHYPELFRHVEAIGRRAHADERCVIFRLGAGEARSVA